MPEKKIPLRMCIACRQLKEKKSMLRIVKNEEGKQILLPGRKEVIQQVDVDQEKITVHLLEGLR